MLRIALAVPPSHAARARHALLALADRWGLPVRFTATAADAHVVYGAAADAAPGALTIPFDPRAYDPAAPAAAHRDAAGRARWCAPATCGPADADPVGGVYRLLALLDESGVAEAARDRRGIFRTADLPEARRAVFDEPLVENAADALLESLLERHPGLAAARLARWPGGAAIALAPSHDVDAVRLGSPAEIATNLAKAVLRRSANHAGLAAAGLGALATPARDPYLTFGTWRAWESARGLTSAFYVFHRPPGTPRELNDCKSSLDRSAVDWSRLAAMHDAGWEFGLHPSIHCKDTPGSFAAARGWLAAKLGRPVEGLRHHYWALDWHDPVRTMREHVRAGFTYDSSIAWRDREGFRAGTALPYAPFDADAGRALELVEIPCDLMDGHVLLADASGTRRDAEAALENGRRLIARVRAAGGVLSPNWHSETAFDRLHVAGYLATLDALLSPLLEDGTAWRATPRQVAAHWRERSRAIRAEAGEALVPPAR